MNKIIYLPLEHIDERYTTHMDRDITKYLDDHKQEYIKIYPSVPEREIKHGSFLDAPTTIEFKSKQIAQIAEMYYTDEIVSGDTIFASDLWFPGLESIAYLNYFCKKDVKLTGILHAGSFTDTDFVRNMERWAKGFEDMILDIADKIYVGSEFIKQDVVKKRLVDPNKVIVTGLPLDTKGLSKYSGQRKKEDIVIFNGRNVDEKQPWLFKELEKKLGTRALCVNTQNSNFSKGTYYDYLQRAKVVVSFALQENFGFGILEAVHLGCIPVLPSRLVYPEFFDKKYLYDHFEECVEKVEQALDGKLESPDVPDYTDCISKWFELKHEPIKEKA